MPTPPALIPRFLALFFLSAYTLGLGGFLYRFFTVAATPEYATGILSLALTGLALGVVAPVFRPEFWQRNRQAVLFWLPFVLLFVSSLAFQLLCRVPLYHHLIHPGSSGVMLWLSPVACMLILVPVFFLTGLYITLNFLDFKGATAGVAVCLLLGLAVGLLAVYGFQYYLHPVHLLAALLPVLALAGLSRLFALRYAMFLTGLVLLFFLTGFGMWRVLAVKPALFPADKPQTAAMRVEGNRTTSEMVSPEGAFRVLDNFTERLGIDLSGQYGFPRVAAKPLALGLYRNGDRLTGLYKGGEIDFTYFAAALDAFPYQLKPTGTYLLIGTDGGFKIHELWGEKRTLTAVEPSRPVQDLVKKTIGGMGGITLTANSPLAVLEPKGFDVIDLAGGFLDAGDADRYAVTVDALARMIVSLKDDGVLSLSIPTGGFAGYAVKLLATADAALRRSGVKDPGKQILVYRSALNARILVFRRPATDAEVNALLTFCRERAFDVSWAPGIDLNHISVLQALPMGSVSSGAFVRTEGQTDALRDTAWNLFQNKRPVPSAGGFNLEPATLDRPYFYGVVPFMQLGSLWSADAPFPRTEIGPLIYAAVLMLIFIIGLGLILPPLFLYRDNVLGGVSPRTAVYFACLGCGFSLLAQALIERSTYFLGTGTGAFYAVLAGMFLFAGWGGLRAVRFDPASDRGIKWAVLRIILCLMLYVFMLLPVLSLLLPLSRGIKLVAVLLVVSPVAYAMGAPLVLGLVSLRGKTELTLPWSLGVFFISLVAALPLGSLIAVAWGVHALMFAAVFLTFISLWAYPGVMTAMALKRP